MMSSQSMRSHWPTNESSSTLSTTSVVSPQRNPYTTGPMSHDALTHIERTLVSLALPRLAGVFSLRALIMLVRVAVGVNSCRLECELVLSGFQGGMCFSWKLAIGVSLASSVQNEIFNQVN